MGRAMSAALRILGVILCAVLGMFIGWLLVGGTYIVANAVFVAIIVAVALAIPPKYDPAIRLKEWLERRRKS